MKYLIIVSISFILITGCSIKNPYVKKGATYGATAGVLTAIAVGGEDVNSHSGGLILVLVAMLGLAGASIGGGIGFIVDMSQSTQKVEEIEQSHKMMEMQ